MLDTIRPLAVIRYLRTALVGGFPWAPFVVSGRRADQMLLLWLPILPIYGAARITQWITQRSQSLAMREAARLP